MRKAVPIPIYSLRTNLSLELNLGYIFTSEIEPMFSGTELINT
jgi:hypothetical protein